MVAAHPAAPVTAWPHRPGDPQARPGSHPYHHLRSDQAPERPSAQKPPTKHAKALPTAAGISAPSKASGIG